MHILRRADYRQSLWKNGQGLTEEVLTVPEGSDVSNFDLRISIAHVSSDGPFSIFPGIDRTIVSLQGGGMILDLPDGTQQWLTPGSKPFRFPGEWAVSSRNIEGPTLDLNIMTLRERCSHEMQRQTFAAGERFVPTQSGWAVCDAPTTIFTKGKAIPVQRFDTIAFETGDIFTNSGPDIELLTMTVRR